MNRSEKVLSTVILLVMLGLIGVFSYFLIIPQLKGGDEKLYHKISIASELSDYHKTLDLVSDFLVEYPDSELKNKVLIEAANSLYEKKEYSASRDYAIKVLGANELKNEDLVEAVLILGRILRDTQKYDSVTLDYLENAYLKVTDIKRQEVAVSLGYAYLYKKDYESALNRFNEAADEWSLIGQALVYLAQDKYDLAIARYEDYFARYESSPRFTQVRSEFLKNTYYYAGILQKKKRYEEALQYYLKIINRFRDSNYYDASLFQIAEIYYFNKKYENAMVFYEKVIENTVFYSDDAAYFRMATIYYEQDKKAKALVTFKKITQNYPGSSYTSQALEWIGLITKEMDL